MESTEMETCEGEAANNSPPCGNKSDSETLSKNLDDIDISNSGSSPFLDFENFSKFYDVNNFCSLQSVFCYF